MLCLFLSNCLLLWEFPLHTQPDGTLLVCVEAGPTVVEDFKCAHLVYCYMFVFVTTADSFSFVI